MDLPVEPASRLAPRLASALLLGPGHDGGYYASIEIIFEADFTKTTRFERVEDPATAKFVRVDADECLTHNFVRASLPYERVELVFPAVAQPWVDPGASDTIEMFRSSRPRLVLLVALFVAAFALGIGLPYFAL
jgi:hypothetical protein